MYNMYVQSFLTEKTQLELVVGRVMSPGRRSRRRRCRRRRRRSGAAGRRRCDISPSPAQTTRRWAGDGGQRREKGGEY